MTGQAALPLDAPTQPFRPGKTKASCRVGVKKRHRFNALPGQTGKIGPLDSLALPRECQTGEHPISLPIE